MKKTALILLFFIVHELQAQIIYKDEKAPELRFTEWINNPKGDTVFKNKHILLDFWATWCSACIEDIPHLNQLTEKYSNNIAFISINSYDTKLKIEQFLKKKKMRSFQVMDSNQYLKEALNIQTIPAIVLIDNKGNLRWKGYASDLTEKLINTFLEENKIIDLTKNTTIINEEIFIKRNAKDVPNEIKVNLELERFTYDQMQTLTRSVDHDYQNNFFFEVKGLSISQATFALYTTLFDNLKITEWDFEVLGKEPKLNYNIKILSERGAEKGIIIDEVIQRMESEFNYKFKILKKQKEVWVVETNEKKLKPYLSKEQDVVNSFNAYDNLSKELSVKNMSFDELAFVLSNHLKEKIVYSSEDRNLYDLQLPINKEVNITSLTKKLEDKYGIILMKKSKTIQVMSVTFL